jgi:hypothetical protein
MLKAPLPDHLYWLTDQVEALLRPAAFLVAGARHRKSNRPEVVAPQGATFADGEPDVPAYVSGATLAQHGRWMESPYDGESFVLQLNLQDIPSLVRAHMPDVPATGIVWVTIDLSHCEGGWKGHAYFDPRPADQISWLPRRKEACPPNASQFVLRDSLSCCTEATLPEIASDWREGGLASDYDRWWLEHYASRGPSDIQVGGWMLPIQGDCDQLRTTLVVAIERQSFGDSGAVYLHYSAERGFFVRVETH